MNRFRLWLIVFLGMGAVSAAHAGFELSGYLRSYNVTRFVLTDLETGKLSPWLFVGDQFQDFMLMRFDAADEVLTLEHAGTVVRLPMGTGGQGGRQELQLNIKPDGTILMGGEPTSIAALESRLTDLSRTSRAMGFVVHSQPGQESFEAITRITSAIRESGLKKWSIRVIDVTTSRKSE